MVQPIVGVIGLGIVGQTLARLLHQYGYRIGAIYNRDKVKANHVAEFVPTVIAHTMLDVVTACDMVILSVTDDAIAPLTTELAVFDWTGKALIHVSGALSLDALQPIRDSGGHVGSLHPALPFMDVEVAMTKLIGATFAIEYSDNNLRDWLVVLIDTLNGHVLEIPAGQKVQYHLALVFLSNYLVTLYATAEALLSEISEQSESIQIALNTLMKATADNLAKEQTAFALTGPLVRVDVQTLQKHLLAMQSQPQLQEAYINLARLSYPMLSERGIDSTQIENLFKDNAHASDNS